MSDDTKTDADASASEVSRHRVLLAVESVHHGDRLDRTEDAVVCRIPSWCPDYLVRLSLLTLPAEIRDWVGAGDYILAMVNLGASSTNELDVNEFEKLDRESCPDALEPVASADVRMAPFRTQLLVERIVTPQRGFVGATHRFLVRLPDVRPTEVFVLLPQDLPQSLSEGVFRARVWTAMVDEEARERGEVGLSGFEQMPGYPRLDVRDQDGGWLVDTPWAGLGGALAGKSEKEALAKAEISRAIAIASLKAAISQLEELTIRANFQPDTYLSARP